MSDTSTARIEVLAEMAARTDLPMTAAALRALVTERDALQIDRDGLAKGLCSVAAERDALTQQLAEMVAPEELRQWKAEADALTAENARLRDALSQLRIDANRLCDRQLGGSYEDDCRRSLKQAEDALRATKPTPAEPVIVAGGVSPLRAIYETPAFKAAWAKEQQANTASAEICASCGGPANHREGYSMCKRRGNHP